MTRELYRRHVEVRQEQAARALEETGYEGVLLHSGTPMRYFADDNDAPMRSNPHFAHWLPLAGPGHLLLVRPGHRPLLHRFAPEDFWYEQAPLGSPFWKDAFDVVEHADLDAVFAAMPSGRFAFVGDGDARAAQHGLAESARNPDALVQRLNWDRSVKTEYEVDCLSEAGRAAARAHLAAKQAFEAGASELEIHQAYVAAVPCIDAELPYESIVALDEKGATLHYTGKRREGRGEVLLLDAGATRLGYASDITRTWTRDGVDARFVRLVEGMDTIEQELCSQVRAGTAYLDLHLEAHRRIAGLLREVGVLRVEADEAVERGLSRPFFPHGLGHFLGIQVHDVSGHQTAREGGVTPPPEEHPFLRTTRTLEPGHVVTIEPGLYFIEMLLRPFREGPDRDAIDWASVDALSRYGGVRIEDDVLVSPDGPRNLTRPFFSNAQE